MGRVITLAIILIFLINVPASQAQEVKGMEEQRLSQDKMEEQKLLQDEDLLRLEADFFSTASKTRRTMGEAPGIVSVITADEIKNMGARTLPEVLQTIPGFQVIRGMHDNQVIGVRGIISKKSNKIKVMINGHNISEPLSGSAFQFSFSEMPVDFIERIEIVRGPGSALYGENAFLAVINIITKKASDIDGTMFGAGGGSFGTQEYNALFGKYLGDVKVSGYADYMESTGKHLEIERDSAGQSGKTDDWLRRLYADLNMSYKDVGFEFFIMDKKQSPYLTPTNVLTDGTTFFDITQMFADLKYEHQVNSRLTIKPRLYFDLLDWHFHDKAYPEGFRYKDKKKKIKIAYPDGIIECRQTQGITWGGELELYYALSKDNNLIGGFQYQYSHFQNTVYKANYNPITKKPLPGGTQDISDWVNFIDPRYDQHFLAFYLQDEWEITKDIILTLGGRYDYYNEFGDGEFSPRLSLVYNPLEHVHLKFLYGEAFRAPDAQELTGRNNLAGLGDPNIKSERIKTYEAGLSYDPVKYFQGEVNFFYNKATNLITFGPRPSKLDPPPYINEGGITASGMELSVKSEYSKDTYIMANYTYTDSRDKNGKLVPNVPMQMFNVSLNTYLFKYLNGNITLLYRGDKKRAGGDTRDSIPGYYLVNLSLLAHDFYPNMEVSASVYNLFDKKYSEPTLDKSYADLPGIGRSYFVFLRYKF